MSAEQRQADRFIRRASPWVDFALTSFYLEDRVDNFINLGVQGGAYLFERLRVSARLVVPLEEVKDSKPYYSSGNGSGNELNSRSISVMYGASVGLVITNSKAFVFGPSVAFLRSDVEAYGTAAFVTIPFEWTTARNLRIGFELGLGHAFDGQIRVQTCSSRTSCSIKEIDRQGGTSYFAQFNFGYALGSL